MLSLESLLSSPIPDHHDKYHAGDSHCRREQDCGERVAFQCGDSQDVAHGPQGIEPDALLVWVAKSKAECRTKPSKIHSSKQHNASSGLDVSSQHGNAATAIARNAQSVLVMDVSVRFQYAKTAMYAVTRPETPTKSSLYMADAPNAPVPRRRAAAHALAFYPSPSAATGCSAGGTTHLLS